MSKTADFSETAVSLLVIRVRGTHLVASDLFQIEVSHLYNPAKNEFTLILHVPMVANSNLLNLYEFLPLPIQDRRSQGENL